MAIQIKYVGDGIGVELLASGSVSGPDIIDAIKEIYSDERFGGMKYLIADKTDCTEYTVTPEDVRLIAALDIESAKINPDLIEAHIAPGDIQFGTSRMWQAYVSEGRPTSCIFRDRESALQWVKNELTRIPHR
jgi:hypothetical protein